MYLVASIPLSVCFSIRLCVRPSAPLLAISSNYMMVPLLLELE